jgi:hypothetical protein
METETSKPGMQNQEAIKAGKKIVYREKKGKVLSEEEKARTKFYVDLVELVNKLIQKVDTTPPKPEVSNSNDFSSYSRAYQNFAQNNVSKREGFELGVTVNDQYYEKLSELLKSQNQVKNK